MQHPRRFVLLDRDGTVIVERHYLRDPEQVELLPGAAEGLRRLQSLGLGLVVITNQSGIARGFFDQRRLEQIHGRLIDLLRAESVVLDGIYCCPHHPQDGCRCRKPQPGLAEQAQAAWGFDPAQAFVVGDKPCDVLLGQKIGACTLLVRTGYGAGFERQGVVQPNYVVDDLLEGARLIERLVGA